MNEFEISDHQRYEVGRATLPGEHTGGMTDPYYSGPPGKFSEFESLMNRLGCLENEVARLNSRTFEQRKDFNTLESRHEGLVQTVRGLGRDIDSIGRQQDLLSTDVAILKDRLGKLEQKVSDADFYRGGQWWLPDTTKMDEVEGQMLSSIVDDPVIPDPLSVDFCTGYDIGRGVGELVAQEQREQFDDDTYSDEELDSEYTAVVEDVIGFLRDNGAEVAAEAVRGEFLD